jgi:hypothetical protein
MSTSPPPSAPQPPPSAPPPKPMAQEIKVISHSNLYYWWPVWFFGFVFTLWTYIDNNRMTIVGHDSKIVKGKADDGRSITNIRVEGDTKRLFDDSTLVKENDTEYYSPRIRVSPRTWMAPLYFTILFLVILITSVPLRGLWSLIAVILIAVAALINSLFELWDPLLKAMGDLHVFMNMAGYLTLATAVFVAWALAIYIFDRRSYMIFTPGQVRVCEEIGGREMVYDTTNLTMEKRRDDWFRHIILGFGSGDLTVRTAGADRHEIVLPNVAFVGSKIVAIEQMLRSRQTQLKA